MASGVPVRASCCYTSFIHSARGRRATRAFGARVPPCGSHFRNPGGVAETQQQRRCVATSGKGLKPSHNAHKVGLHLVVGISPNVGRMAAVIDDHATYRVGDMGGGRIEVHKRAAVVVHPDKQPAERRASQCGVHTPGFVSRAHALLVLHQWSASSCPLARVHDGGRGGGEAGSTKHVAHCGMHGS